MKVEVEENGKGTYKIKINDPFPAVDFQFQGKPINKTLSDFSLSISEDFHFVYLEKPLGLKEHVVGLGEKATELDRRRFRYTMYNIDAGPYFRFQDPLYVNIPFFISIENKATGYFINSASKLIIDVGFEDYSKIKIKIPHKDVEIYVFEGPTIENVLERFTDLTGKPYLPPEWAFGYMISRYSYYPQDRIIELLDEMKKQGFKVSAVFLDIDFMDSFKLFTWNKERFPDPKKFIEELHKRGVKLITIVDHSVRADQNYETFLSGLGKYCETDKGDIFVGKLWPGSSVYPDFFREETRNWWKEKIASWLSQGIDGIWLDMNEPTDFTKVLEIRDIFKDLPVQTKDDRIYRAFPSNVTHLIKGKRVHHELVRNAYPLYEAMATYQGFKEAGRDEIFILSRSGYAGIQSYATIWTGDNTPCWEDLKLQLQLVLGLSISGVSNVGIDIGAFQGRGLREIDNSPELLTRYFQLALFFPFFRTHKATDGIDTEPIYLPDYYKEKVKEVINLRYKFLPYLYAVAEESHELGHPILRPLFYEFQNDENTYRIEDEYMVGKSILYAPVISPGQEKRKVYLPKGKWLDYWSKEVIEGGWIDSVNDLPIYIRENSIIPLSNGDLIVFGEAKIKYKGNIIESNDRKINFSKPFYIRQLIYVGEYEKILVNGKEEKEGIEINEEVKEVEIQ
ncbi:alpha-glucosidase MalA [Acidianus manzaensis]|uniref:Alpha-glucosidase n=1 Tax=Acidianus manzaensis TaxID=282676 RepID=A0A1W6JYX5_9CREN|nr:alpha-glucosidase MalA [Acidianus manzaensis]ARM75469.1 alpha-glucosidase [Acidianus manzaensis]